MNTLTTLSYNVMTDLDHHDANLRSYFKVYLLKRNMMDGIQWAVRHIMPSNKNEKILIVTMLNQV